MGRANFSAQRLLLFSGFALFSLARSDAFPLGRRRTLPETRLKRRTLQRSVVITTINLMPLGTFAQRNFILVQSPVPRLFPRQSGEVPQP